MPLEPVKRHSFALVVCSRFSRTWISPSKVRRSCSPQALNSSDSELTAGLIQPVSQSDRLFSERKYRELAQLGCCHLLGLLCRCGLRLCGVPSHFALSRLFGRGTSLNIDESHLPVVSLLIAAHNESRNRGKNTQCTCFDIPRRKTLEVAIASDGSTDRTNDIVRRYASRGVKLFAYERIGARDSLMNRFLLAPGT